MSWWDKAYKEISGGADKVLNAYTEIEKAKASSFQSARAEQMASRNTPQVDSQNRGEPISVKPATPERQLVGDAPKDSAVVDKKMLYIGGGVAALLLLVGVIVIAKK